jgi:hypothetical protein
MQEKHLFEYAVIRVVPRVEREEFVNAGVVLYCARKKFLRMRYELNGARLKALCGELDLAELETHLRAFESISAGTAAGGTIAQLPPAERFRWLTAVRSTVVQTSRVHVGLSEDLNETLENLFAQLVAC